MTEMDSEELKRMNGKDGNPVCIAFQEKVYDITQSPHWNTGVHMGRHSSGQDLTKEMEAAPHGPEVLDKFSQVGILKESPPSRHARGVPEFLQRAFDRYPLLRRQPHPMTVHFPIAFLEAGNVGIIPDPGYPPYLGGVTLCGGIPHRVPLRPENDFLLPLEDLRGDIVARAKLLYLNYPNNPTTACAPREYLEEAVAFCHRHGLILMYDNAYSEVAFDGYRPLGIFEIDGAREVAVEFHSFSKTFNMTGWRLGWAAGNPELIGALRRVKTWMDTGGFLAVQAAGVAALESYDEWVPGNVANFQTRRDAVVEALRDAGFQVERPKATMYVWADVPKGETAAGFAGRALEEKGVILLPGSAMGAGGEGFFRIALTVSPERLIETAERLGDLIA